MQLSVACLLPYSFVLFHSSSLLNSCCTPDLDRAKAYCASALLIKLMQDGTHEHQTVLLASMLWQDVVTIKLSHMYDPFIIPFKTTDSSTSESLMPVIEYLYPSYSALSTATLQNLTTSIIIKRICNLHLQ